jgi:hypothetical protein
MKFSPTEITDIYQLMEWGVPESQVEDWLSGNADLLSFCLQDEVGPLLFCRYHHEGDLARMYTIFGPEPEVSKKRIAIGMTKGLPVVYDFMKKKGIKGIIYTTPNEALVKWMSEHQGFSAMEDGVDQVKYFEG